LVYGVSQGLVSYVGVAAASEVGSPATLERDLHAAGVV
jgi:hypothetical protein